MPNTLFKKLLRCAFILIFFALFLATCPTSLFAQVSIVERSPTPNSDSVPVDGSITIRFSNNMQTSTLTTSNIYLRRSGSSRNISVDLDYSSSGRTVTVTPRSDLDYDTVYYVYVTDRVRDVNNNQVTHTEWRFTTVDSNTATLVSRYPQPNSIEVPLDAVLTIEYSRAMNSSTINTNTIYLQKVGQSQNIPINVSYNNSNYTVTITPQRQLDSLSVYTVYLTNRIQDNNGNSMAASNWSFTTVLVEEEVFAEQYPGTGELEVPVTSVISVRFRENVLHSSLTNNTIFLRKAGSYQSIPFDIDYSQSNRTVRLIPKQPLEFDTIYEVTLTNNIRTLSGYSLFANYSWSFATEPAGMLNISARSPFSNQNNVPVNEPISVKFTRFMNPTTINSSNVYVRDVKTESFVPTSLVYNNFSKTLTIKPQGQWNYGTTYRVYLTDELADTEGAFIQPLAWNFTTRHQASPGVPTLLVLGKEVNIANTPPYLKNGRVLIPFRSLFEALGAQVGYDISVADKPKVWAVLNNKRVELIVGESVGYANGTALTLDVPAESINGRTMIPVRFAAEALGMKVNYDKESNRVTVQH